MLLAYVVWNPKLNSPTIHSVKEFSKDSGLLFLGGASGLKFLFVAKNNNFRCIKTEDQIEFMKFKSNMAGRSPNDC